MNRELKSILSSLSAILLYIYATEGWLYVLYPKDDDRIHSVRTNFTLILLFIISFILIVALYYILGNTDFLETCYWAIIGFHIFYIFAGMILIIFKNDN